MAEPSQTIDRQVLCCICYYDEKSGKMLSPLEQAKNVKMVHG